GWGRPALVEVWDERFFYFVAKFEMNFIDTAKKAACLSTVQIDVENTDRFDINYVTEDGHKRHPLLMHTSVSGSLDRNVYAILENQAMRMQRGEKAAWTAGPIQGNRTLRTVTLRSHESERPRSVACCPFGGFLNGANSLHAD